MAARSVEERAVSDLSFAEIDEWVRRARAERSQYIAGSLGAWLRKHFVRRHPARPVFRLRTH